MHASPHRRPAETPLPDPAVRGVPAFASVRPCTSEDHRTSAIRPGLGNSGRQRCADSACLPTPDQSSPCRHRTASRHGISARMGRIARPPRRTPSVPHPLHVEPPSVHQFVPIQFDLFPRLCTSAPPGYPCPAGNSSIGARRPFARSHSPAGGPLIAPHPAEPHRRLSTTTGP